MLQADKFLADLVIIIIIIIIIYIISETLGLKTAYIWISAAAAVCCVNYPLFCGIRNWLEGPSIDFVVKLKLIVKKWRVQGVHPALNSIRWRAVVKKLMNDQEAEKFLSS
jgi:hypothetical protein